MLSFLSSAKSFHSENRDNQLRAIRSWLAISSEVEVMLYGRSDGAEQISTSLGIRYVPEIKSTAAGVPYFNAIADHAKHHARHNTQIYLNCDILMTDSILKAIDKINFEKFLMIGQKVDLHENASFEIARKDWLDQLVDLQKNFEISLHPPSGKDYFVFPRGLWDGIPALVVGRIGYDCGLLTFCLQRDIPIIDATHDVVSIHQYHSYRHLPGGLPELLKGPDAEFNVRQIDTKHSAPQVSDAGWTLRFGKLEKSFARGDRLRNAELFLRYRLRALPVSYALRAIWKILTALAIYHVDEIEIEEVLRGYALSAVNQMRIHSG